MQFTKLACAGLQGSPGIKVWLLRATLPKFLDRRIQENRGDAAGLDLLVILPLRERSPTQSNDPGDSAVQLSEHLFEDSPFRPPELGFSGVAENLRHRSAFAGRDAVIEIFKDPIQPLPEGAAYAAFPGSHEADQENRIARRTGVPRRWLFAPLTSPRVHGFARTLLQKLAANP